MFYQAPNHFFLTLALVLAATACGNTTSQAEQTQETRAVDRANLETAIFAAGCFWCVEEAFDKVEGVVSTTSGFTGGHVENPTYKQVTGGDTGHTEAVEVKYDPSKVSYGRLLEQFWLNVDPTDDGGQFCDRGDSYRSAIFYTSGSQQEAATESRKALLNDPAAPSPIVTPIIEASPFYAAKEYHQNYYQKNPIRYKFYKTSCGRADTLEDVWGDYQLDL